MVQKLFTLSTQGGGDDVAAALEASSKLLATFLKTSLPAQPPPFDNIYTCHLIPFPLIEISTTLYVADHLCTQLL